MGFSLLAEPLATALSLLHAFLSSTFLDRMHASVSAMHHPIDQPEARKAQQADKT
jgi:hypothetical protein